MRLLAPELTRERERAVDPRVRMPGVPGEEIMIMSSNFFSARDLGERRVEVFLVGEMRVLRRLGSKMSVIRRCLRIARTVVRPVWLTLASVTRLCLRGCCSSGSAASSGTSLRTGTMEAGVSDRRLSEVRRDGVVEGGAMRDLRTRFSGALGGPFWTMFFRSERTEGLKTFGTSDWLNDKC